jgi:hypothetical protein
MKHPIQADTRGNEIRLRPASQEWMHDEWRSQREGQHPWLPQEQQEQLPKKQSTISTMDPMAHATTRDMTDSPMNKKSSKLCLESVS